MSSIFKVVEQVKKDYSQNASTKLRMVDGLIVYSAVTAVIQALYVVFVGTFPFNSFLSGFLCHLALFALGVSLRFQLSHPSDFRNVTPEKAFGDFAFCALVLFFVVYSFMG